ncbi:MAG: hypothetical protein KUG77_13415 [Nannocystaceae bacterium]|nr:hypothetical protein [Nannocystaceae bacterium]
MSGRSLLSLALVLGGQACTVDYEFEDGDPPEMSSSDSTQTGSAQPDDEETEGDRVETETGSNDTDEVPSPACDVALCADDPQALDCIDRCEDDATVDGCWYACEPGQDVDCWDPGCA